MARRITITINDDEVSDLDAIMQVAAVIQNGKVSVGPKGREHYSFANVWENKDRVDAVYTRPKYTSLSDRFVVTREKISK